MASSNTCKDCKFFEMVIKPGTPLFEEANGECHFFPPHAKYGYPLVRNDNWCSKHQKVK